MKTEDQVVDLKEAALFLKTSEAALKALADRGGVPCVRTKTGRTSTYRFRIGDLVKKRRRVAPPTLQEAVSIASEAAARVAHLEGVVENLLQVLGLKGGSALGTSVDEARALHREAEDLLREYEITLPITGLRTWAGRFLAVTEEFLRHFCSAVGDPYAWRTLLELATRIEVESMPKPGDGPGKEAHSFLQAGRRSLRATCFFYVEKAHGKTVAAKLIKKGEDLNSVVLRFLRMS